MILVLYKDNFLMIFINKCFNNVHKLVHVDININNKLYVINKVYILEIRFKTNNLIYLMEI